MIGKIVKGISGFYYVSVAESGIYECKAKGAFRRRKLTPMVGDMAELRVLDETARTGTIERLLPRKNKLIRPAVANIDQALVIFAAKDPAPNLHLLNRFLVMMEYQDVPVKICFNKADLLDVGEQERLLDVFLNTGYDIHFTQAVTGKNVEEIKRLLTGKTTAVAGPSGVGKSTLINALQQEVVMETGAVSKKIRRGKHTTRHSELIFMGESTYIMDTPGFSSVFLPEIKKEELGRYFPEFEPYANACRFLGCAHRKEPDCAVKEALDRGEISWQRYEDYELLYRELEEAARYG